MTFFFFMSLLTILMMSFYKTLTLHFSLCSFLFVYNRSSRPKNSFTFKSKGIRIIENRYQSLKAGNGRR